MFGLYRTLLALLVVWQHLSSVHWPTGKFAVHGFFILSGYLMTYVMHESYGYSGRGRVAFAGNRALRLYPSWFAVAFMAVLIIGWASNPHLASSMDIPRTLAGWLQNLSLIYVAPMPNMVHPRLSPATWALTIELFYYAAICLGVSKNKLLTWIWFLAGALYHVAIYALGADPGFAYFHILSGSLPFSIGALVYHYKPTLPALPGWLVAIAGTVMVTVLAVADQIANTFYLNMVANLVIIAMLVSATGSRTKDKFFGDFSYHLYIMHWPIGLLVLTLMGISGPERPLSFLIWTVAICLGLSLVLTNFIDKPVERWRRRLCGKEIDMQSKSRRGLSS